MSAVTAIDGIFVGHGVGSDGIAAHQHLYSSIDVLHGCGTDGRRRMLRGRVHTHIAWQGKNSENECNASLAVRHAGNVGAIDHHPVVSRCYRPSARFVRASVAICKRLFVVVRAFAAVPDMGFHCAFCYSAGRCASTGDVVQHYSGSCQYRIGLAVRVPIGIRGDGCCGGYDNKSVYRRVHQHGLSALSRQTFAACHAQMEPKKFASVAAQHRLPVPHRFIGTIGRKYYGHIDVHWQSGIHAISGR